MNSEMTFEQRWQKFEDNINATLTMAEDRIRRFASELTNNPRALVSAAIIQRQAEITVFQALKIKAAEVDRDAGKMRAFIEGSIVRLASSVESNADTAVSLRNRTELAEWANLMRPSGGYSTYFGNESY